MGNIYIGDSNSKAKNITNVYVGVNGVARKVKAIYIGVSGVARLVWQSLVKKITKCNSAKLTPYYTFDTIDYNYQPGIGGHLKLDDNTFLVSVSQSPSSSTYDYFNYKVTVDDNGNITSTTKLYGYADAGLSPTCNCICFVDDKWIACYNSYYKKLMVYDSSAAYKYVSYSDFTGYFSCLNGIGNNRILALETYANTSSWSFYLNIYTFNSSDYTLQESKSLYLDNFESSTNASGYILLDDHSGVVMLAENYNNKEAYLRYFTFDNNNNITLSSTYNIASLFTANYHNLKLYAIDEKHFLIYLWSTSIEYILFRVNDDGTFSYSNKISTAENLVHRISDSYTFLIAKNNVTLINPRLLYCDTDNLTLTCSDIVTLNDEGYRNVGGSFFDSFGKDNKLLQVFTASVTDGSGMYTKVFDFC